MGLQLNSNEIAEILPHRYPFALVDRITDGESGVPGPRVSSASAWASRFSAATSPRSTSCPVC